MRMSAHVVLVLLTLSLAVVTVTSAESGRCRPTHQDEIGPFYRPNAPLRTKIGEGYVLSGVVRDAVTCRPIPDARIEVWLVGPAGEYGDQWRATLISDRGGRYRIEMNFPVAYARRPPLIHILVDKKNFAGLITQHYPKAGKRKARFDLVIERE